MDIFFFDLLVAWLNEVNFLEGTEKPIVLFIVPYLFLKMM